jgi:hypothetical protein
VGKAKDHTRETRLFAEGRGARGETYKNNINGVLPKHMRLLDLFNLRDKLV